MTARLSFIRFALVDRPANRPPTFTELPPAHLARSTAQQEEPHRPAFSPSPAGCCVLEAAAPQRPLPLGSRRHIRSAGQATTHCSASCAGQHNVNSGSTKAAPRGRVDPRGERTASADVRRHRASPALVAMSVESPGHLRDGAARVRSRAAADFVTWAALRGTSTCLVFSSNSARSSAAASCCWRPGDLRRSLGCQALRPTSSNQIQHPGCWLRRHPGHRRDRQPEPGAANPARAGPRADLQQKFVAFGTGLMASFTPTGPRHPERLRHRQRPRRVSPRSCPFSGADVPLCGRTVTCERSPVTTSRHYMILLSVSAR